jgi:hypothetical protein
MKSLKKLPGPRRTPVRTDHSLTSRGMAVMQLYDRHCYSLQPFFNIKKSGFVLAKVLLSKREVVNLKTSDRCAGSRALWSHRAVSRSCFNFDRRGYGQSIRYPTRTGSLESTRANNASMTPAEESSGQPVFCSSLRCWCKNITGDTMTLTTVSDEFVHG